MVERVLKGHKSKLTEIYNISHANTKIELRRDIFEKYWICLCWCIILAQSFIIYYFYILLLFTSRIEATFTTPYVIYLVTCGKQGVGSMEKLPARISNYYSHIRKKRRTNKIAIHFQEAENHTEEDMNIQIIDQLLSILGNQEESTIKLKRVEGFWQAHLRTVGENGLNTIDELLRN